MLTQQLESAQVMSDDEITEPPKGVDISNLSDSELIQLRKAIYSLERVRDRERHEFVKKEIEELADQHGFMVGAMILTAKPKR